MDNELIKKFRSIENIFFEEFDIYVNEFAKEIEIKIKKTKENTAINNNWVFIIELCGNNRKIQFAFYEFSNENHANNFYLGLENLDIRGRYRHINMYNYLNYRKIEYDKILTNEFPIKGKINPDIFLITKQYLSFFKQVFSLEEIQKCLYTDFWIEIDIY